MHYEENDHRHPHHSELRHRHDRRMHHPRHHEEHFQDFRSRWGEPEPLIHLNHQNRHPHDLPHPEEHTRHPQGQDYYHREQDDWHDPRHNKYQQHQDLPIWRQQDVYFDRSNQRAEDRWLENETNMMPHPHHPHDQGRKPHPRDERWNEYDENEY